MKLVDSHGVEMTEHAECVHLLESRDVGHELDRLGELRVTPWADGHRWRWMRLVPNRINGRRVGKDWVP